MRSVRASIWYFPPVLALAFVFLIPAPVADDSPVEALVEVKRAQRFVEDLRFALAIEEEVRVAIVLHHPLVFAVERAKAGKVSFVLSMELGFVRKLNDSELQAALAHELGHVWIFTHHPFLHTERLANEIGLRIVRRDDLERVYYKLWAYEGSPGVPMEQLLGPRPALDSEGSLMENKH